MHCHCRFWRFQAPPEDLCLHEVALSNAHGQSVSALRMAGTRWKGWTTTWQVRKSPDLYQKHSRSTIDYSLHLACIQSDICSCLNTSRMVVLLTATSPQLLHTYQHPLDANSLSRFPWDISWSSSCDCWCSHYRKVKTCHLEKSNVSTSAVYVPCCSRPGPTRPPTGGSVRAGVKN